MESTKTIGGHSTSIFIDPPPANLICSVCIDVFKNPHQCKNGHIFCLSCITESLESKQECPVCRTYLKADRLASCLFIRDMIGQLQTKCLFTNCPWTGSLDSRDDHIQNCNFELVTCPLYKQGVCGRHCWGNILREQKEQHVESESSYSPEKIVKQLLNKIEVLTTELDMVRKYMPVGTHRNNQGSDMSFTGVWKSNKVLMCGTVVDKRMNGYCSIINEKGTFRGNRTEGVRNGKGRMEYANGDIYDGEYKNGVRHGFGTFLGKNVKYVGEWKEGKRHGVGTLYSENGSKYVGEFQNGNYHGQGTLKTVNGIRCKGVFVNGQRLSSSASVSDTAATCSKTDVSELNDVDNLIDLSNDADCDDEEV